MKNVLFFLALTGALAHARADTPPKPAAAPPLPQPKPELELNIHTAEPPVRTAEPTAPEAENSRSRVLEVDETLLLADTELLSRAMYSAVVTMNVAGIKVLLPIYEKWPQHDKELAMFGRALVLQHEGQAAEAVKLYRILIAAQPDSPVIRLQLAQALFEDQQNEAAADQFDRLKTERLPEAVVQRIESYREALRQRDSWQLYAGVNLTREQNINQAPKQQRLGEQLEGAECERYRQRINEPDNDCFVGWRFNPPIDAAGLTYQAGAEKKQSLKNGFYAKAGADVWGKVYRSYSQYNDASARLSAGLGRAGQRNDTGATVFHERRFYGNDAYSYTNGVRLYWNRWWLPKLQSFTALETGRLNNQQRPRADIRHRLASASLVFHRNARQYWLVGQDFYQERNRDDRSDNFNRFGLRAAWGQEWKGGLSSRVQVGAAKRIYYTPSLFSNDKNRRDKEWNASVSLWHRAVHFGGITPRLTFSHNGTSSNDVFYEHSKNRLFIEMGKTF
ncbi:surface lipoprotein assembly modifier [Neisseria dentiae]|uniref:surface lipoprotein assembly modifier n=2 Tax=Neisseria dentiae TaxID=194197 RepID=UPI00359FCB68